MPEKRWKRRHRKRIPVRFGTDSPNKLGYVEDINDGGVFIRSAIVMNPGSRVLVEMPLDQGNVSFEAEVRWAKRVPAHFLHKLTGGLGVQISRFLTGEDLYRTLCEQLSSQRGS